MSESERIDGVAVVTGAASGIGLKTAQLLASRGATLVLSDIDENALNELRDDDFNNGIVARVAGDISDPKMPDKIAAIVCETGNKLAVLVNNAGIAAAPNILQTNDATLQKYIDVNLVSVFRMCRATLPIMVEQKGGAIVNVSSVFGLTGVGSGSVYAVTKGAVATLTEQLACEFGSAGIRVNAVAPGLIETPLTSERIKSGAYTQTQMLKGAALGRAGRPEEVAEVIAFLASSRSAFITGEVIKVDGGWVTGRLLPHTVGKQA